LPLRWWLDENRRLRWSGALFRRLRPRDRTGGSSFGHLPHPSTPQIISIFPAFALDPITVLVDL